ncbi:MAG: hypothetical protein Ct9H300mP1_33920 [Planctomycetaceae bacterium]|nr:MAG: hypothetical protein Ct9H300mP1_33920 [Planctomycetaceae bacterium]
MGCAIVGLLRHQVAHGRGNHFGVRHHGGFQRGAVRGGSEGPVDPLDRGIKIVETTVGLHGGDLGTDTRRANVSSTTSRRPVLATLRDRLGVQGEHCPRIDQFDGNSFGAQFVDDLQGVVHHSAMATTVTSAPSRTTLALPNSIS